jgi:tetratricopeptide (TPR) repeat protein
VSEDLAALEEQRDILLKSLRDLEQERAAGEVADDDYAVLKDDYTARAAAVLRTIEAHRGPSARRPAPRRTGSPPRRPPALRGAGARPSATRPARPRPSGTPPTATRPAGRRAAATRGPKNQPVPRRQRTLAVSLGVAFVIAALAGMSVVLFAGGRSPGQPVTGSVPGDTAVASRVDDALALENDGNAVEALQLYDEILADEPDNVEALAYRGWLLKRAGLADQALESLDRAVAVDPTFADAHFFRGMVLLQDRDDPAGAVLEFQAFLANDPPPDFVDAVGEVLAQAQAAATAKAAGATTTIAP